MPGWLGLLFALVILTALCSFVVWAMKLPTPEVETLDGPEPTAEEWAEANGIRTDNSRPDSD